MERKRIVSAFMWSLKGKKGGVGGCVGDGYYCCGWGEIPFSKAAKTKDFDSRFGSGSGLGTPVPINSLFVRWRKNLRRWQVRQW